MYKALPNRISISMQVVYGDIKYECRVYVSVSGIFI